MSRCQYCKLRFVPLSLAGLFASCDNFLFMCFVDSIDFVGVDRSMLRAIQV